MIMRITAPCQVNGEPQEIGTIIDVTEPGEAARLKHFGQAVPTDNAPTPVGDKKAGRPNIPPPPAPEHKEHHE